MAARKNKTFYVYQILDGLIPVYIGKGSGRRLANQKKLFGLEGNIIKEFASEKDAFRFERELISQYRPEHNRNAGGGGGAKKLRKPRKFAWEIEIERVGTRKYVAQFLYRNIKEIQKHCPDILSKVDEIRRVAYG